MKPELRVCGIALYVHFWFKYNLDRNAMHPKFDLTWVRTHDLQIMNSTFHVPEMLSPLDHRGHLQARHHKP